MKDALQRIAAAATLAEAHMIAQLALRRDSMTIEQFLEKWSAQPGNPRLSIADHAFIANMRHAASQGVGYGFMKQMIDIEWRHKYPESAL